MAETRKGKMAKEKHPLWHQKPSNKTRFKISKSKIGTKAIFNSSGQVRFVREEDAKWLVLAEGWEYGRGWGPGRPKGRPKKIPS